MARNAIPIFRSGCLGLITCRCCVVPFVYYYYSSTPYNHSCSSCFIQGFFFMFHHRANTPNIKTQHWRNTKRNQNLPPNVMRLCSIVVCVCCCADSCLPFALWPEQQRCSAATTLNVCLSKQPLEAQKTGSRSGKRRAGTKRTETQRFGVE